ncbi:hypothetical protein OIU78_003232 [Salix suchowensis]|nr:hypothetical protein OIU78_003232 [Salix suchowensis]
MLHGRTRPRLSALAAMALASSTKLINKPHLVNLSFFTFPTFIFNPMRRLMFMYSRETLQLSVPFGLVFFPLMNNISKEIEVAFFK